VKFTSSARLTRKLVLSNGVTWSKDMGYTHTHTHFYPNMARDYAMSYGEF